MDLKKPIWRDVCGKDIDHESDDSSAHDDQPIDSDSSDDEPMHSDSDNRDDVSAHDDIENSKKHTKKSKDSGEGEGEEEEEEEVVVITKVTSWNDPVAFEDIRDSSSSGSSNSDNDDDNWEKPVKKKIIISYILLQNIVCQIGYIQSHRQYPFARFKIGSYKTVAFSC